MTTEPAIEPAQFVALVQPMLETRDVEGLVGVLKRNWTAEQITALLSCPQEDARKVAALALALVGCKGCISALADQLRDPDPLTNQMAEHALWSIWFRSGNAEANRHLAAGTDAMNRREYHEAIVHFGMAATECPDFAEAYNQRAIAWYLLEQYEKSIADCKRAVKRMPCHFGAWAGMGHCYAHLGRLKDALHAYERALEINPHLDCVRQAANELRNRIC